MLWEIPFIAALSIPTRGVFVQNFPLFNDYCGGIRGLADDLRESAAWGGRPKSMSPQQSRRRNPGAMGIQVRESTCHAPQVTQSGGQDRLMRHCCRLHSRESCPGRRTMLFELCISVLSPRPNHRTLSLSVISRVLCRPLTKFRSPRSVGSERFPGSVYCRDCQG